MTKKGIKLLFLVACLSLVSFANAQISFFAPTQMAEPGTFITTPITVTNFDNIIGTSFSLGWNPGVLEFQSVQDFGLEDIDLDLSFGTTNISEGKLGFLWFDIDGASLSNNATIFSVTFEVIGMTGDSSQVAFTDDPTQKVVEPQSLEATFLDGYVKVDIADNTGDLKGQTPVQVSQCYPNPFERQTTLTIETVTTESVRVLITDEVGRTVYTDVKMLLAGKHQIHIDKETLGGAGIYFLNVETSNRTMQQKLIVQ